MNPLNYAFSRHFKPLFRHLRIQSLNPFYLHLMCHLPLSLMTFLGYFMPLENSSYRYDYPILRYEIYTGVYTLGG